MFVGVVKVIIAESAKTRGWSVRCISEWIEALSNRSSRNCGAASIMKDSGTPKSQVLDFNINKIRRYVIDRLGYQHVPIPGDKRRRGFTHFYVL